MPVSTSSNFCKAKFNLTSPWLFNLFLIFNWSSPPVGEGRNMKLKYKTYNLPFTHPFTISKGTKTHQPTLITELEFMGIRGYGEAPAISYYNIPVEKSGKYRIVKNNIKHLISWVYRSLLGCISVKFNFRAIFCIKF